MKIESLEAGPELNTLIATKVMGWKRMSWMEYAKLKKWNGAIPEERDSFTYSWHDEAGEMVANAEDYDDYYHPSEAWNPSVNIAEAWEVWNKLPDGKSLFEMKGQFTVSIPHEGGHIFIDGPTAPFAICRAAGKAVGL